jgi:DNA topoisomerase IB
MPRLRRSDCSGPGTTRIRRGRGFSYRDPDGDLIKDPALLERIAALAIPPAWQDVWICADELGHLQATGTDAAGRKQYIYHPLWHARRDRAKFDRMLAFAEAQPRLRRRVTRDLGGGDPNRQRVLAGAVRLLDLGLFRVGSDEYAEENGSLGLTTLRKEHVAIDGDRMRFDYPAKSGQDRVQVVQDRRCAALLAELRGRRGGGPELLAYRESRRWHRLSAADVNDYLKAMLGEEFSAKDFRTWNATVIASAALAGSAAEVSSDRNGKRASARKRPTKTSRERDIKTAVAVVAESLGNTPAVARRSYIDPRVLDRYRAGKVLDLDITRLAIGRDADRRRIEGAVLDLLAS